MPNRSVPVSASGAYTSSVVVGPASAEVGGTATVVGAAGSAVVVGATVVATVDVVDVVVDAGGGVVTGGAVVDGGVVVGTVVARAGAPGTATPFAGSLPQPASSVATVTGSAARWRRRITTAWRIGPEDSSRPGPCRTARTVRQ